MTWTSGWIRAYRVYRDNLSISRCASRRGTVALSTVRFRLTRKSHEAVDGLAMIGEDEYGRVMIDRQPTRLPGIKLIGKQVTIDVH